MPTSHHKHHVSGRSEVNHSRSLRCSFEQMASCPAFLRHRSRRGLSSQGQRRAAFAAAKQPDHCICLQNESKEGWDRGLHVVRLSAGSTILEELDFPFFFRLKVGFSLDYGVHVLVLAFMFLFWWHCRYGVYGATDIVGQTGRPGTTRHGTKRHGTK